MKTDAGGINMQNEYTVIVVHSTGETAAVIRSAPSPWDAILEAAKELPGDSEIIGAVPGRVELYPPCEDSGKTAAVEDVLEVGGDA